MTRSDPGAPEPELPDRDADRPGPGRPDVPQPGAAGPGDDDAVWLDLVARLEGTDSGEPDDGTTVPAAGTTAGGAPGVRSFKDFDPLGLSAPTVAPQEPAGPRDYAVDDDDDGAFVPEEPPSLAGTDPLTMLAWLGAVGGPIALLLSAMFWRSAPLLAVVGMVAAFAVSVVFLIMKLPHEKDEYDDGARL
ncbi:hypothetical protein ACTWLI_15600 [Arthrobacter sp. Hor0625]|uniref:hypothetical protein n=1 Tax=Arthrobacter sp. Hor0625 TaxID=3457358 RepID=UPI00403EBF39